MAVAGAAKAEGQNTDFYRGLRCENAEGQRVTYVSLPSLGHASLVIFQTTPVVDTTLQGVQFKAGKAYIAFNRQVMDAMNPEVREFYFAHECAHHKRNHASVLANANAEGRSLTRTERHKMEHEADCDAAIELMAKGYNEEKLKVALSDLTDRLRGELHPDGNERIKHALQCAGLR